MAARGGGGRDGEMGDGVQVMKKRGERQKGGCGWGVGERGGVWWRHKVVLCWICFHDGEGRGLGTGGRDVGGGGGGTCHFDTFLM